MVGEPTGEIRDETGYGAMRIVIRAATAMLALTAVATAQAQTKPAPVKPTPAKPAASAPAAAKPASGAETAQVLLESKDWKAVTAAAANGKMCFAMGKPQKMEPPTLNHGNVVFYVTTRTADNVRNEPSLQVGYPFKENSKLQVDIDGKKFGFFAVGDFAWLEPSVDYATFLEALKKGSKMSIGGTSGRGNPTSYVFALSGIAGAIDAAAKACK